MGEKKKEKKPPRPYFQKMVSIFFEFCREKFGESPSFDGSAPRDLGMILDSIQKKAVEKDLEWTEDMAERSFSFFLQSCWEDSWLQQNFLLFNMNRQKDKIFFKIKEQNANKQNNRRGAALSTSDSKIEALRKWGKASKGSTE